MRARMFAVGVAMGLLLSCSGPTTARSAPSVAPTQTCHIRGAGETALPDPKCTPGATDSRVTQANISHTICKAGWSASVRPPESYTNSLKHQQMAQYGETGPAKNYEEDHLISLELGGAPSDPRNLWPEPGGSPNEKDKVENSLHRKVCSGAVPLATAQQIIASNWLSYRG